MSEEDHGQPSSESPDTSGAAMDFATLAAVMSAWEAPSPEQAAGLFPGYEVHQIIGRGGMGAVYLATQVSLDRLVAIKLLPIEISRHAGFAHGFQREARIMARLHHPNIIAVHDFGQTSAGHLFIVMEYVEGENLHEIIHGVGLDADQALSVIGKMCTALSYAHGAGVVHRDIKPGNVMIDAASQVKVADFGLARLTGPGTEQSAVMQVALGTPDYAAPEQVHGLAVDHRADIYSLGVMLYEMLCRQVPSGAFQMPSARVGCDPRIDAIVIRAMQQRPERRYQSAAELKADVDRARKPVDARRPVPAGRAPVRQSQRPQPQRPQRRAPVVVASRGGGSGWWIGLGFAGLAVVGYFMMRPKPQPPKPVAAVTSEPAPVGASTPKPVVATPRPVIAAHTPPPEPERPVPATPAPKALSPTGKWIAEEVPKWEAAFQREVSGPFEKGAGELKKQHLAAINAQLAAATQAGQLDAAVIWRAEAKRLADGGEVPETDEFATPPVLQSLQMSYRKRLAALEAERVRAGKAAAARYDAVLAASILALTQKQRIDEALELKLKREQVAAEWERRSAPTLARVEPAAATPGATSTTGDFFKTAGSLMGRTAENKGRDGEAPRKVVRESERATKIGGNKGSNLPDNVKVLVPTSQSQAQEWHYTTQRPPDSWFEPSFADIGWSRGMGAFGSGNQNPAPRTPWKTDEIWLRRIIEIPFGAVLRKPHLYMYNDDEADVYLNGKKVGTFPGNGGYEMRELDREAWSGVRGGRNSIAVHCRNNAGGDQYIDVGIVDVLAPKAQ